MTIQELIKSRRSIRKFKAIPVKNEDLLDIIEAGTFAPSGSNTQCYRFVVTTSSRDIRYLGVNRLSFFKTCKAVILCFADWSVCSNNYPKKSKLFAHLPYLDCGASMQNMLLMATEKGLGTCWITMHPDMKCMDYINHTFEIPTSYEIMGSIAIGYADEVVDYETGIHAKRPIKRKNINHYIWRKQ